MELLMTVSLLVVLLGAFVSFGMLGSLLVRRLGEVEQSWKELYRHQLIENESLRNRLMAHRWEEYHNLQASTPYPTDRLPPPTHLIEDVPDKDSDLRVQLERAMEEMDLEGGESWKPTVG